MKVFFAVSLSLSLIFTQTGCASNRGPKLIPVQRLDYNQEAIRSQNEQMLLNLVRLRYNDTPLFLELNTIVTQYDVQNSASLSNKVSLTTAHGAKASADTEPTLGASMSFSEKPTISYTPLQGEAFARQILTPIPPETLVLLSQSGWSISRLFLLCVQRMNGLENAVTASGPTPTLKPTFEAFQEVARLFRELQSAGLLSVEAKKMGDNITTNILFLEPSVNQNELNKKQTQLRQKLGLHLNQTSYELTSSPLKGSEEEIALNTRSLSGVLFFLSQSVRAPFQHEEKGLVRVTHDPNGAFFDWSSVLSDLMKIESSRSRPKEAFVEVFYRNHWFYIDDSDRNSKATYSLLNYLFALQSAAGSGASPLLTLSAG